MPASVLCFDQKSALDQMAWGRESVAGNEQASFNLDMCPRAVRLLIVAPPQFVTSFFAQILPAAAAAAPHKGDADYWEEVRALAGAIDEDIEIPSQSFRAMRDLAGKLLPAAQQVIRDNEVAMFAHCFLNTPARHMDLPELNQEVVEDIEELVASMHEYFCANLAVAKRALEALLLALAAWELEDRLRLTSQSLGLGVYLARFSPDDAERLEYDVDKGVKLPPGVAPFNMSDALLLVGAQRITKLRRIFYLKHLMPFMQKITVDEFEERCDIVRRDPLMVVTLLQQLPARYPRMKFEEEFVKAVYPDLPVPEDVGRQALAFGCENLVMIWVIMRWPRMRVIHKRLHALIESKWHVSKKDFARIVYRNFKALS